jgi:anti-sigma factor RsiW
MDSLGRFLHSFLSPHFPVSVFIFQEQSLGNSQADDAVQSALSFNVRSWNHNGLRYFIIGDASAQDLDKLSELMKAAG